MFDDFYGFRGRPFQLTPDPAFYFESLTHRKALSYLSYGLAQGEGFIVITGEIGAGKSTLVAHLMATIDRQRLTAAQIATVHAGEDMIQAAALAFGLPVPGAIEAFLHDEARAGRRCLLVVDEAQRLSAEALDELRMLSNFQLGAHPLLQILLLGQPEFRDMLHGEPALEPLRQRVIAAHHLEAMQADEIEPYVTHRLRHVGWAGHPAFDAGVFADVHEATRGVPRRVNQVMSRLLLLGAVEQKQRIDRAMLGAVLAELAADGGFAGEPDTSPAHAAGFEDILAALATRDTHIAELQQAVIELANGQDLAGTGEAPATAELEERLARLEARMSEQERMLRHTLTMLIEWMERGECRHAA